MVSTRTLLFILPALLLACSEEPQQLAASDAPGYVNDDWDEQLRSRAQRQDESNRIYH